MRVQTLLWVQNSDTPFTGFKNMTFEQIEDRSKVLYKAIRNGTFKDDTFVLLEYALKELQLQAYQLGTTKKYTYRIKSRLWTTFDDMDKSLETINDFKKTLKDERRIENSLRNS